MTWDELRSHKEFEGVPSVTSSSFFTVTSLKFLLGEKLGCSPLYEQSLIGILVHPIVFLMKDCQHKGNIPSEKHGFPVYLQELPCQNSRLDGTCN